MVNKSFTITNISIFILIIVFSSLLLSSNDLTHIKIIIPFLKFYQKNQSSKLIHSITAVEPNEDCPKNYFPLSFYTFPGTSKGCLISNNTLEKDSCSLWNIIFKSTSEVEELEQKNFNIIFSKKICVNSFDENNYLTNINNNKNNENKKLCGLLDTNGKKYYVEKDKECPINKILINNKENIDDDIYNFNTIELIKGQTYLHYSNNYSENNNYLLTNESLYISEGYPCINPDEINTFHIQYLLSKANSSYTCNTNIDNIRTDSRYIPITNIQKYNLYEDNNINLDNFFNYPYKDVELTLYQLGYIGTDSNFNTEIVPNINKVLSDTNSIYNLNIINQCIIKIIFSLIFIIIVCLLCKYFISDITIYIWNYILLTTIIINLVFNIIVQSLLSNLGEYDKYYSNKDNDQNFNLQMKYISDVISDLGGRNIKIIVGNICIFILVLLFNIVNYFIFNNPKQFILKYKGRTDYNQDKKYYNSINVLKPTSLDVKNENLLKFKEEIELPKIEGEDNNNDDENENIIGNSKDDEEENNLTTENNDN